MVSKELVESYVEKMLVRLNVQLQNGEISDPSYAKGFARLVRIWNEAQTRGK